MKNDQILSQISEFCRQADMAESTFGRRAVNDGKLVHRLREGKRITIDTLDRIQAYIAASMPGGVPPPRGLEVPPEKRDPRGNFRFFENRQKYLLFVHTCSEKRVIAERVALELGSIHPRPPALRVFDAGVGDGTVLARVMRVDARPLSPYAVLYRRQGTQPRGRPADAGKGAGPAVRAPGDRFCAHQHVLRRGALADAGIAGGGRRHDLARGGAAGGLLGRIRGPDRRTWAVSGAELAGQCQPALGHADL